MVKINDKKLKKQVQANNKLKADERVDKKKKKKVGKDKSTNAPAASLALGPSSAPLATPAQVSSSACILSGNGDSLQAKEKGGKTPEQLYGFIFMCNGKTKPQCFQFRVFGLPIGRKEVVERIKPGTKLFLFDVESKLLYGTYEATSEGKINLEPAAFEGKFPAQVKFKILNGCLPLPELSFKKAIIDNYQGIKFNPELSKIHVNKLMLLFRPLVASLSAASTLPIPDAAPPVAWLPSKREDQWKPPAVYLSGTPMPLAQRITEQHPVQGLQFVQHQQHAAAALVDRARSALELRSFPFPAEQYYSSHSQPSSQKVQILQHHQLAPTALTDHASLELNTQAHLGPYYHAYSHPTYSSGSHGLIVQEPHTRYHALQERYHQAERLETDYQRLLLPRESETAAVQEESGAKYQRQLPLLGKREAVLDGTSVGAYYSLPTAPYISSTRTLISERPEQNVPDPLVPLAQERETILSGGSVAAYYPLSTTPYVPSTVAVSYSLSADPYIPSTVTAYQGHGVEPYIPSTVATYQTDLTASYASPTMQPTLQPHAPTSGRPGLTHPTASYYMLARPARMIR